MSITNTTAFHNEIYDDLGNLAKAAEDQMLNASQDFLSTKDLLTILAEIPMFKMFACTPMGKHDIMASVEQGTYPSDRWMKLYPASVEHLKVHDKVSVVVHKEDATAVYTAVWKRFPQGWKMAQIHAL